MLVVDAQYERTMVTDEAAVVNAMSCTAADTGGDRWTLMAVVRHSDDDLLQTDYQFICQFRLTLAPPADGDFNDADSRV